MEALLDSKANVCCIELIEVYAGVKHGATYQRSVGMTAVFKGSSYSEMTF